MKFFNKSMKPAQIMQSLYAREHFTRNLTWFFSIDFYLIFKIRIGLPSSKSVGIDISMADT